MNAPDIDQDIRLQKVWITITGNLAQFARPLLQRSGKLVIECKSSVWATNFRAQAPSILGKFKDRDFPVKEIVVRVKPSDSTPRKETPKIEQNDHVIPISEKSANDILKTARTIKNPRLKTSLENLALSAKRRLRNQ
ncbi:MAG: DUF721 domain-containing protein [Gammaproteobacteria bacterium]|nr:DUF721 domain-containing protein [Gammaproteobacteria bacterium]MCY4218307.1 DUF721 domain-containing protein [Gammaproteobacteria bacterium]MCY4275595.1 DUF721 domain-containing protein [Gammaproteobacteria bacterium]